MASLSVAPCKAVPRQHVQIAHGLALGRHRAPSDAFAPRISTASSDKLKRDWLTHGSQAFDPSALSHST
jgi:hypothetical protein